MNQRVIAKLNYLKLPPRKVRFVADVIRGMNVNEAEARLMVSPRRPSAALLKLLRSAIANAVQNAKLEKSNLYIKEIAVNQGPMTERWMPRARGSASPIQKKTSHVTLVLGVSEKPQEAKFVIREKPKKVDKEKRVKEEKTKKERGEEAQDIAKPKQEPGFFRKVFRRKSI